MTKKSKKNNCLKAIDQIEKLGCDDSNMEHIEPLLETINGLTQQSTEFDMGRLAECSQFLSQVVDVASCLISTLADPSHESQATELGEYIRSNIPILRAVHQDETLADEMLDSCKSEANEKWGDYLDCIDEPDQSWGTGEQDPVVDEPEDLQLEDSGSQIGMVLSALESAADSSDESPEDEPDTPTDTFEQASRENAPRSNSGSFDITQDKELLDAYLDDANRCLESMEQSVLSLEERPDDNSSLHQFCRELHTLKGASASVGLAELATFLHGVEEKLEQSIADDKSSVTPDDLLEAVDAVRSQISDLTSGGKSGDDKTAATTSLPSLTDAGGGDEASIRIRVSQVEKLMDMLAELVVLRNRRDSNLAELNALNDELMGCSSRLRFASAHPVQSGPDSSDGGSYHGSNTFEEVSNDITEIANSMQMLHKPVSEDNQAISQFIGHFRYQLMQLNRVPVAGLFKRLQRGARDAAKAENKQIQISLVGEEAGIEQSIQERIFEPMLHMIRNAVSHGIEASAKRSALGKSPVGQITLEARANANLMEIEVRDDGGGLDYNTLRSKAQRQGLLAPNRLVTEQELAQLIFHPGFSTKDQASEISGRGVGMDIVATAIQKLQGRVDIDSIPGRGTTMRVSIPLRSGIEHVMVFRTGNQLLAIPMHGIFSANHKHQKGEWSDAFSLADILSIDPSDDPDKSILVVGRSKNQLAISVDSVIGPEEVVVRTLPTALQNHPLICGATLSGNGEIVLLIDTEHLIQACKECEDTGVDQFFQSDESANVRLNDSRILVVDDSLSARKSLVRILQDMGLQTIEAGDGVEALKCLEDNNISLLMTDLDMPRLGGIELISEISQRESGDIPTIVVSSRDKNEFLRNVPQSGSIAFLPKPVSDDLLTGAFEELGLTALCNQ